MPLSCSSECRSVQSPVKDLTSVVLPWSTWPTSPILHSACCLINSFILDPFTLETCVGFGLDLDAVFSLVFSFIVTEDFIFPPISSKTFFAFVIIFSAVAFPTPFIFNFNKSSGSTATSFSIESIPAAFIFFAVDLPIPEISSNS
ncbi:hypothetical protein ES705_21777 [subsurface metagenome]